MRGEVPEEVGNFQNLRLPQHSFAVAVPKDVLSARLEILGKLVAGTRAVGRLVRPRRFELLDRELCLLVCPLLTLLALKDCVIVKLGLMLC